MSKVSRNHKPLSIRVLVVDDCPDGREMVTEYLTFRGFAVTVATGGADAIAQVQRVRPDIVLMDLRMPGINGWKATRALKAVAFDTPRDNRRGPARGAVRGDDGPEHPHERR